VRPKSVITCQAKVLAIDQSYISVFWELTSCDAETSHEVVGDCPDGGL
jgi:hypothetical protein